MRLTLAAALTLAGVTLAGAGNIVTPPIGPPPGQNARCDVFNAGKEERSVFIFIVDANGTQVATSTNPVHIAPGEIGSAFNPGAFMQTPVRCEVGEQFFLPDFVEPLRGSTKTLLTTLCALDANDKCVAAVSAPVAAGVGSSPSGLR